MKKQILISLLSVFACIAVWVLNGVLTGVFADKSVFPNSTTIKINSYTTYALGRSPAHIYKQYIENSVPEKIKITAGDKTFTVDFTGDRQHSLKESDIQDLLTKCGTIDYIFRTNKTLVTEDRITYNTEDIVNTISKALKKSKYKYTKAKNAYFDKKLLETVKEKTGTEIDPAKAADGIMKAIEDEKISLNLNSEEYYKQPDITEKQINEKFADVIKIGKWSARYSVSDYVIDISDYPGAVQANDDGTYELKTDFLKEAVLGLSKTVDKIGQKRKFKSTLDGNIWVSGGTYGQMMDNEKEIAYLEKMLKAGKEVKDREPVWKIAPPKEGSENTYIEVDISAQHLWYYKSGKLIMQTDVVTGLANGKRNTPTGWYFVSEKVNGKYLIGEGYKTWVNKWMRLTNTGIGLHDATWRGSFGGNIYKYNGSHGCINLPPAFAAKLYDKINTGIMVVVHN